MLTALQPRKIVLGTAGYLVITFPLAFVWHLVLFEKTYDDLGYFSRDEPIVAFGFGAILLQGVVLSIIYPHLCRGSSLVTGALMFALMMGTYHWTAHVLAEAAKHAIEPLATWFALESTYLAIQFLLGGFLLAVIYRDSSPNAESAEV